MGAQARSKGSLGSTLAGAGKVAWSKSGSMTTVKDNFPPEKLPMCLPGDVDLGMKENHQ